MAGAEAQGVNIVKAALEMLQRAQVMIPLGSELHTDVLKSVSSLSKHVGKVAGGTDPQALIQQLMQAAREARMQPPPGAMVGGGPPGGAPAPPAMPPMGGQ